MKNRIWELLLLSVMVAIGAVAYNDDRPTYSGLETEVLAEPFVDGHSVIYRWTGKIERNCRGYRKRFLVQGDERFHLNSSVYGWLPKEDWHKGMRLSFEVSVPDVNNYYRSLKEGEAEYHVISMSQCNQIQALFGVWVEEAYPPIVFNVSKPKD